jgi:Tfp pilus assembly protein PilE
MATVAIVGILAMVATMSYRSITNSAKMAEATYMLQAIRVAQESYRAETGTYLNLSKGLALNGQNASNCYPPGTPRESKIAWDPAAVACGGACNTGLEWTALNVQADSAVRFCYSTVAGVTGEAAPTTQMTVGGTAVPWGDVNRGPWFVVAAMGDVDRDGEFSTLMTSTWRTDVVIDNDGE